MSDKDFTMFDLSSGLPLDGARVAVISSTFTYNQEYSADAVVLDLEYQPLDEDGEATGEAKHQLYSVGKKWEPANDGESVEHGSGKRQMFNTQTNIGKLIHSYLQARGNGDEKAGMQVVIGEIDDYGQPDQASFWLGLDVTLKSIEYTVQSGKTSSTFGISEYHGRQGEAKKAKAGGSKLASKAAPAKAAPAKATKSDDDDAADTHKEHLGRALYAKLTKLAKEADDHDAFMNEAFDLDDVTSDDKKWNKVTEAIIMGYNDDSLFATARG